MKMVITLKSGVQIKQTVENYTVERNSVSGDLKGLKWVYGAERDTDIMWFDADQVAAVHSEFDPGDAAEDADAPAA